MEMFIMMYVVILVFALIGLVVALSKKLGGEKPWEKAGRDGEAYVTGMLQGILREGDVLLTNVNIVYHNRRAEFDEVIINSNGVFIIEVKNYSGQLIGGVDDQEWLKRKVTKGGNVFEKMVRNPIPQVQREVTMLTGFLRDRRLAFGVNGYVYFVENNSPVQLDMILHNKSEIDRTIHAANGSRMSQAQIDAIVKKLQPLAA